MFSCCKSRSKGVFIHWTGMVDWNTGLDYWNEFESKLDHKNVISPGC